AIRLAGPQLRQPQPAGPDQLERAQVGVGIEAGREHDHVELVQAAVARDDAAWLDVVDRHVDELDVRALELLVEARGHHQPLAHRCVIGGEPRAQAAVAHRAEVQAARRADPPAREAGLDRRAADRALDPGLKEAIAGTVESWKAAVRPACEARVASVAYREDPLRRALIELEAPGHG